MKKTTTWLTALALSLALLLTSCAGGASATTMHLRKTEGAVGVSDGEGKELTPKDNLGLYSGYQVGTQAESYAWIDLDKVKLTKLDQDSEVEINKEGKKLEINVKSGSLFFNVTEPLADDEIMNIATSTMMIGVRGTCGWVTGNTAALLEGTDTGLKSGRTYTLTFSGDYYGQIPMKLERVALEGERTLAVFSCRSHLADTAMLRIQTVDVVARTLEGIRVPRKALRVSTEDVKGEDGSVSQVNRYYVYTVVSSQAEQQEVEVLYSSDTYYLVRPVDQTSAGRLRAGDEACLRMLGRFNVTDHTTGEALVDRLDHYFPDLAESKK